MHTMKIWYISDITTFDEVEDSMLIELYSKHKEYPSLENYLKRIINRNCDDKDDGQNDTLHIWAHNQIIKFGDYLTDAGFGGRNVICDFVKDKIGKKPNDRDALTYLGDEVFSLLGTVAKF